MPSGRESSVLALMLFRRGRRPGAYMSELEDICGDDLEEILDGLRRRLDDLGLEMVTIDDRGDMVKEGKKRVFVRARSSLRKKDVKLCGWDRRFLAALAATTCFLTSRGGRAREAEVVDILKTKGISSKKIETMLEAGYLSRDDGVLSLSWRALAEIDQERLKSLFVASGVRLGEEENGARPNP